MNVIELPTKYRNILKLFKINFTNQLVLFSIVIKFEYFLTNDKNGIQNLQTTSDAILFQMKTVK